MFSTSLLLNYAYLRMFERLLFTRPAKRVACFWLLSLEDLSTNFCQPTLQMTVVPTAVHNRHHRYIMFVATIDCALLHRFQNFGKSLGVRFAHEPMRGQAHRRNIWTCCGHR